MSAEDLENGEFYLRYYVGHKGKFGHEFLEFEFRPDGKLRYANNSNYKNDTMIRKEVYLTPAVLRECRRIISDSEVRILTSLSLPLCLQGFLYIAIFRVFFNFMVRGTDGHPSFFQKTGAIKINLLQIRSSGVKPFIPAFPFVKLATNNSSSWETGISFGQLENLDVINKIEQHRHKVKVHQFLMSGGRNSFDTRQSSI